MTKTNPPLIGNGILRLNFPTPSGGGGFSLSLSPPHARAQTSPPRGPFIYLRGHDAAGFGIALHREAVNSSAESPGCREVLQSAAAGALPRYSDRGSAKAAPPAVQQVSVARSGSALRFPARFPVPQRASLLWAQTKNECEDMSCPPPPDGNS